MFDEQVDERLDLQDEMEFECILKDRDGEIVGKVTAKDADELISKINHLEEARERYIDAVLEPDYDLEAKYTEV